jgi:hypothetical protein
MLNAPSKPVAYLAGRFLAFNNLSGKERAFSMLSKEAIEEFKELYKARYGVLLNDDEAAFRANNLVNLYKHVYGDTSDTGTNSRGNTDSNDTA